MISFAHFGNGITVYDTSFDYKNDHIIVAHISPNREVKYRKHQDCSYKLTELNKLKIEQYAKTENPSVSYTQQDLKVFLSEV